MRGLVQQTRYGGQCLLAVAHHSQIHPYVLVDFAGVNVEMDDFRLLGISVEVAGNTVVETHAYGNKQVALVGHHVGTQVSVHSQHTHIQGMVRGKGGKSKQRAGCRQLGFLQELAQFFLRIAQFHTLAHQHERLHTVVDQACGLLNHTVFGNRRRLVTADKVHLLRLKIHHTGLGILGKVEHHWTGTAAAGNIESTAHRPCNILGTANLEGPFADGLCHADDVHFLKSVRTQHGCAHLAADHNHRGGIHHGVGNTGNGVHGTGTAGHNGASHLSAHTGIALCRMYGTLFMANQNVVQCFFVVIQSIVCGDDGTAGIAEEDFHPFVLQRTHHGFRT